MRHGEAMGRDDEQEEDEKSEAATSLPSPLKQQVEDVIWLTSLRRLQMVDELPGGDRIVVLATAHGADHHGAPPNMPRGIRRLLDMVNEELGWTVTQPTAPREEKMFIFVSKRGQAVGCLVVEPVEEAFRVVGEMGSECSTQPEPALMGVSRIWVHHDHRRKGIATRLLDSARTHFVYGYTVRKSECAFTQPTRDGHSLAARYLATPNFLVYK